MEAQVAFIRIGRLIHHRRIEQFKIGALELDDEEVDSEDHSMVERSYVNGGSLHDCK
eukprot:CAMPEP_0116873012 /NCGR_PEP_ID=MMETSP0463-20121206/3969_1 /TAXON_ID=181622 /ORGANISM="Strombidinopsis sp, Strain SopsisLIS2011" /LENGTH=56 /DNA_ID=CAMNT_0004514221 /DNA_START=1986 /DNA_END=2156 /DNA_ORIENTATION=-